MGSEMDSIDADASHGTAAEEGHPLEAERSCACGRSQRVSGLAASARVFVCEACAKREILGRPADVPA